MLAYVQLAVDLVKFLRKKNGRHPGTKLCVPLRIPDETDEWNGRVSLSRGSRQSQFSSTSLVLFRRYRLERPGQSGLESRVQSVVGAVLVTNLQQQVLVT